jgi:LysM repeat protein
VIPNSGGKINTYPVPLEYDPEENTWKFLKPPKQVKTFYKGDTLPNGKVYEGDTPVQIDVTSEEMTYPGGTALPDKYVPVPRGDARLVAYPEPLHKYLHINKKNNQISFHPSFTREMQQLVLKEARPSATQRFSKWLEVPGNEVQSFADLEPWTGTSQESKLWFATQNLAPDHPLHIDAQNQLNLKHVKVTPNAIIVGRGYKDPSKPYAVKRLPEPTTEKIETGNSVSALAKKHGTTESQIIAANPDWFDKDMNGKVDTGSMRTSEQMGGAEMIIPTGKSKLSQSQINEAHSSRRRARVTEMPYGTIIPIQTATVGDGLRLNTERLEMQNIQKSVKDFVELMQNPKARGFGKIGKKEKGELEGIRQRLINNVQVLRDYGVLSPSEIENIERSVPAVNSIIALMTRGLGSDEFVVGAMNTLYQEAVNNERKLDALIKLYGAPVVDYDRYEGGIPGFDATGGGSEIEILDDELDSFGG